MKVHALRYKNMYRNACIQFCCGRTAIWLYYRQGTFEWYFIMQIVLKRCLFFSEHGKKEQVPILVRVLQFLTFERTGFRWTDRPTDRRTHPLIEMRPKTEKTEDGQTDRDTFIQFFYSFLAFFLYLKKSRGRFKTICIMKYHSKVPCLI